MRPATEVVVAAAAVCEGSARVVRGDMKACTYIEVAAGIRQLRQMDLRQFGVADHLQERQAAQRSAGR
eukprot:scaffold248218_cov35-Tisochrysis_lutea.AAC.1